MDGAEGLFGASENACRPRPSRRLALRAGTSLVASAAVPGPPVPSTCPDALQVRLLRLRDTERVVQYGTQLLDKHSRRLDPEERELQAGGSGRTTRARRCRKLGRREVHSESNGACATLGRACRPLPGARSLGGARAGGNRGDGGGVQGACAAAGEECEQALPIWHPRQQAHGGLERGPQGIQCRVCVCLNVGGVGGALARCMSCAWSATQYCLCMHLHGCCRAWPML